MKPISLAYILNKYSDTIKEEVNVKELHARDPSHTIEKIYKPNGAKISPKFGKDTWLIIKYGKMGNIKPADSNAIIVYDDNGNEWLLENGDYDVAFTGIEWDNVAVDNDILVKLDLEITPTLEAEWVAREISRFLNQLRKEAAYDISDKIHVYYTTQSEYIANIITQFESFLMQEALIISLHAQEKKWDVQDTFSYNNENVVFALLR